VLGKVTYPRDSIGVVANPSKGLLRIGPVAPLDLHFGVFEKGTGLPDERSGAQFLIESACSEGDEICKGRLARALGSDDGHETIVEIELRHQHPGPSPNAETPNHLGRRRPGGRPWSNPHPSLRFDQRLPQSLERKGSTYPAAAVFGRSSNLVNRVAVGAMKAGLRLVRQLLEVGMFTQPEFPVRRFAGKDDVSKTSQLLTLCCESAVARYPPQPILAGGNGNEDILSEPSVVGAQAPDLFVVDLELQGALCQGRVLGKIRCALEVPPKTDEPGFRAGVFLVVPAKREPGEVLLDSFDVGWIVGRYKEMEVDRSPLLRLDCEAKLDVRKEQLHASKSASGLAPSEFPVATKREVVGDPDCRDRRVRRFDRRDVTFPIITEPVVSRGIGRVHVRLPAFPRGPDIPSVANHQITLAIAATVYSGHMGNSLFCPRNTVLPMSREGHNLQPPESRARLGVNNSFATGALGAASAEAALHEIGHF
jgi:hypothetical protein